MLDPNVKEFLLTAIVHEVQCTQRLYELLVEEETSLRNQDIDCLKKTIRSKSDVIDELESSNERRLKVFGIRTIHHQNQKLFEDQIRSEESVYLQWLSLKEWMNRCKIQNEVNGKIIYMAQKGVERTVNLFRQALRPAQMTTYSNKGKAQTGAYSLNGAKA